MQTTANYGFNIVEGADIVNPLTQLNPNFTALDTDLKAVSDATYDKATCVKSGTNHAVTRIDTDKNLIIFTATGNWETGDTMTVDGSPVSVYLPDGTSPLTGSFIINTEVMMIKSGSRVTIYTDQKLPAYTASDITYDNAASGLSATNVQDAIDEIVAKDWIPAGSVNIVGGTGASNATAVGIPADAKEVLVQVKIGGTVTASTAILRSELLGACASFAVNASGAITASYGASIDITNGTLTTSIPYRNGADISVTATAFYK